MSDFSLVKEPIMMVISDSWVEQLCACQDVAFVLTLNGDTEEGELPTDVVVVMDGHGPDLVIDIIREEPNLHEHFAKADPAESLQQLIEEKIPIKKAESANKLWNYYTDVSYHKYLKNKVDLTCIRRSGATLSFAKIYRNVITKKIRIEAEWLGDSPIMILVNGGLVFNAEMHHADNEKECKRLQDKGVLRSITKTKCGFEVLSENRIICKSGNYVCFTNNEGLACTRSLGHNRITGIETQKHVVNCSMDDEVKVIICSDGVGDVLNLECDMEKLKMYSAYEIVKMAEARWKQTWNCGDRQTKITPPYDDCSCAVWWQKKV